MGFHRDDFDYGQGRSTKVVDEHLRRLQERNSTTWEETDFPLMDIYETPEYVVVEAELPGIDTTDLEVSVLGSTLVIEGLKKENLEPGRINFLCMERTFGSFRRMVPLFQPVDVSRVTARYREGLLQIKIPTVNERRGMRKLIPVVGD